MSSEQTAIQKRGQKIYVILLLIFFGGLGIYGWQVYRNALGQQEQVRALPGFSQLRITSLGAVQSVGLEGTDDHAVQLLTELDLPALQIIDLIDCKLGEPGFSALLTCEQLYALGLTGSQFDPELLFRLGELQQLRQLDITDCDVPEETRLKLQKVLPRTRLYH